MTQKTYILAKLQMMLFRWVGIMLFCGICSLSALNGQVLQPTQDGIGGKVVASSGLDGHYYVLYQTSNTGFRDTFTVGHWNGVYWEYMPHLTAPEGFDGSGGARYVFTSVMPYQGYIYVGGFLENSAFGSTDQLNHIQRWNGTAWEQLSNAVQSKNFGVKSLAIYDDKLIVAGQFASTLSGNLAENIATFDGGQWNYLGIDNSQQGTNGPISCVMVHENRLYVAGAFTRFAGKLTGNIAFYSKANGEWGGIGSPMDQSVYQLAYFGDTLAALGQTGANEIQVRLFNGSQWSQPISFAGFTQANPTSITALPYTLLIGGEFKFGNDFSSLLSWRKGLLSFSGNRINGNFKLQQSEQYAFISGDFTEQNSGISKFAPLISPYGVVSGTLYFDADQSCSQENGETGLGKRLIKFTDERGKGTWASTDGIGHFVAALPAGRYSIQVMNERHWINVCQGNYAVNVRDGEYSFVNLARYIAPNIQDAGLQINPLTGVVVESGDRIKMRVQVKNMGSSTLSGQTIHFKHHPSFGNFASQPLPDNYTSPEATYTLKDLKPGEELWIDVYLDAPDGVADGTPFGFSLRSGSLFTGKDPFPADNTDSFKLVLGRRSGTGNTKECLDGSRLRNDDKDIGFNIRFRNNGLESIKRVVIVDTLDADLPMDFVSIDGCSHQWKFYIASGNAMVIDIENANLAGNEKDPLNSQGYLKYTTHLWTPLAIGTQVTNTAYITYDQIKTEKTNTVQTISFDVLKASYPEMTSVVVYPNPGKGLIFLPEMLSAVEAVMLTDLSGKSIQLPVGADRSFDVSALSSGQYTISFLGKDGMLPYRSKLSKI